MDERTRKALKKKFEEHFEDVADVDFNSDIPITEKKVKKKDRKEI